MRMDIIADALTRINQVQDIGRMNCKISPVSNLLKKVLKIFKDEDYVQDFEIINDGKGGIIKLDLTGQINECGAIKPRFSVSKDTYEKFEKRFLPAKDFGLLIVSTTEGVMTHHQAKKEGIGGQLIAYVY